ncbi:Ribose-phosphate pyrophosphokinase [Porphyridium purpureum]|uniref:ribose-phosphate diphosphokinase n=1 Tax=Porphyridium purpureum TaxID=35688 RepID=A0A5J4Z5H0_PORPP|nr:Ribose-phosphate pyrophosphokinase [Porphyridium purpureum]|eukprot:POR5231..scf295_1
MARHGFTAFVLPGAAFAPHQSTGRGGWGVSFLGDHVSRRAPYRSCVRFSQHHGSRSASATAGAARRLKMVSVQDDDLLSAENIPVLAFTGHRMKVYSGSANPELAEKIARLVGKTSSNRILRKKFSDGETYVRIEESVRGCNVFLIQSACGPNVNDHLIELLLMIDACRRAHSQQITVCLPYYCYSRSDRLIDPDKKRREALTSKLVANMLSEAGAHRVVVLDIHSPQTCGFFDIPVDHIFAAPLFVEYLLKKKHADPSSLGYVVVAPDVGGVARARAIAKALDDVPLAIIDKRREAHNEAKVLNLVGDVRGKVAILVDDMIDTAGTICEGARMLRENGAEKVFAVATHPIFSGPACERLSSGVFEEVIVSDSIPVPKEKQFPQLRVLSVAPLIADQLIRLHDLSLR